MCLYKRPAESRDKPLVNHLLVNAQRRLSVSLSTVYSEMFTEAFRPGSGKRSVSGSDLKKILLRVFYVFGLKTLNPEAAAV